LENTGSYEWVVTGPGTDQATVKVVAHDADGNTGENESDSTFMIAELAGVETATTTDFVFNVVSGGPLNRWREFGITAPYEAHVAVTLFDVRGREVAVIADRVFGAGEHTFSWNTATPSCEVSPGVYFVRMEAPGTVINRKIVLLR
jgi:hypothetical protein